MYGMVLLLWCGHCADADVAGIGLPGAPILAGC